MQVAAHEPGVFGQVRYFQRTRLAGKQGSVKDPCAAGSATGEQHSGTFQVSVGAYV